MRIPKLTPSDALIVVDVQNDFCPGGALPVKRGAEIVSILNRWLAAAERSGAFIIASRDWHPAWHVSFREQGGPWPVHCVQNQQGAEFHPRLNLPPQVHVVSKGTAVNRDSYSALGGTDLVRILKRRRIKRLWVGGLALDYCVRATILDALQAGFEVHLIKDATRAVNVRPGDGRRTIRELLEAGCIIERERPDAQRTRTKPTAVSSVHRSVRADDGSGVRRRGV